MFLFNTMNTQSWNNVTRYIKRKLGVPLNFLELSDDDIKEIITDDVLPAFSQYIGKPAWFRLGAQHLIGIKEATDQSASDLPAEVFTTYYMAEEYRIPVPDNMAIVDIQEIYWPQYFSGGGGIDSDIIQSMGFIQANPMDIAMMNTYSDIIKSMQSVPTFRFISPDKVLLDTALRGKEFIIECKTIHTDLTTIPSDMYHEIFKPYALAEIIDTVVQMRKKYRTLSTPFGEINLNYEDLQQRHDQIMQTVQEKFDSLPPDRLIEFI